MNWEEYYKLTCTLLDFYRLDPMERQQVLLMMDGLKYRAKEK